METNYVEILTIADAVAVVDFCHKRQLLCDECGDALATVRNSYHQRCDAHKALGARYEEVHTSALEKHIVGALDRWNAQNCPDNG